MDWYKFFMDEVKDLKFTDVFGHKDLYIALCRSISMSEFATIDDLKDLTKAFQDYEEEMKNESITTAI